MTSDTPGAIAHRFFARLDENDVDAAMALCDDAAAIWMATAAPADSQNRGTGVDKATFGAMLEKSKLLAPDGMRFVIHRTIEEAGTAVLEVESRATLADGRLYNNLYCFILDVEGGKITSLREYFDSKYATDFFLHLLEQSE